MSATVDLDQLAALLALRRGFGDVQVLEVVGRPGRHPAPGQGDQGELFEEVTSDQGPAGSRAGR
jgi:hypothetical protein